MKRWLTALLVVTAGLLAQTGAARLLQPTTLTIDPAESHVSLEVGRSGLFGFAGHNHEIVAPAVNGQVTFSPDDLPNASVSVEFQAAALKVTGKGDPPSDVPEVQKVMLSDQVLDAAKFPVIGFRSTRITATPHGATAADLAISGTLTLHGVTRPIAVRANTTFDPSGLTARGTFTIKQTEFGMEPVTAGGGTVRVKDDVAVQFVLRARKP